MIPPRGQQPPTLQEILPRLTNVEMAFFVTLDAQLEKVEKFYQAREAALQTRTKALKIQLEELGDHKRFLQVCNWLFVYMLLLIRTFVHRYLRLHIIYLKPGLLPCYSMLKGNCAEWDDSELIR
jgi:hypothetical protein